MKRPAFQCVVATDGNLRCLYSDDVAPLLNQGATQIRRASYVEPTPAGKWVADLTLSHGPMLGPFELRGQALEAERRWLTENVLGGGGGDVDTNKDTEAALLTL